MAVYPGPYPAFPEAPPSPPLAQPPQKKSFLGLDTSDPMQVAMLLAPIAELLRYGAGSAIYSTAVQGQLARQAAIERRTQRQQESERWQQQFDLQRRNVESQIASRAIKESVPEEMVTLELINGQTVTVPSSKVREYTPLLKRPPEELTPPTSQQRETQRRVSYKLTLAQLQGKLRISLAAGDQERVQRLSQAIDNISGYVGTTGAREVQIAQQETQQQAATQTQQQATLARTQAQTTRALRPPLRLTLAQAQQRATAETGATMKESQRFAESLEKALQDHRVAIAVGQANPNKQVGTVATAERVRQIVLKGTKSTPPSPYVAVRFAELVQNGTRRVDRATWTAWQLTPQEAAWLRQQGVTIQGAPTVGR